LCLSSSSSAPFPPIILFLSTTLLSGIQSYDHELCTTPALYLQHNEYPK
jgi:hypothetical protein